MEPKIVLIILVVILILLLNLKTISPFSIPFNYRGYLNKMYQQFKPRFKFVTNGSGFGCIDMVYTVSMPERTNYITSKMKELGLNYMLFDAVKPRDLSESDYNVLSTTNEPGNLIYNKKTRLPVMLSFVMCFLDALENGYNTICIFEDDIVENVSKEIVEKSLCEFKASDMDSFFMGYCFLNCKQPKRDYQFISELSDPSLVCCHAMCYKTKMLPGLIDYCFKMTKPCDELFTEYFVRNKIKVGVPKGTTYFDQVDRFNRPDDKGELPSLNESTEILKYCR